MERLSKIVDLIVLLTICIIIMCCNTAEGSIQTVSLDEFDPYETEPCHLSPDQIAISKLPFLEVCKATKGVDMEIGRCILLARINAQVKISPVLFPDDYFREHCIALAKVANEYNDAVRELGTDRNGHVDMIKGKARFNELVGRSGFINAFEKKYYMFTEWMLKHHKCSECAEIFAGSNLPRQVKKNVDAHPAMIWEHHYTSTEIRK